MSRYLSRSKLELRGVSYKLSKVFRRVVCQLTIRCTICKMLIPKRNLCNYCRTARYIVCRQCAPYLWLKRCNSCRVGVPMSLCASCGLLITGEFALCPHHHAIFHDDWAEQNRAVCNFIHRHQVHESTEEEKQARQEFWRELHITSTVSPHFTEPSVEAQQVSETVPAATACYGS